MQHARHLPLVSLELLHCSLGRGAAGKRNLGDVYVSGLRKPFTAVKLLREVFLKVPDVTSTKGVRTRVR